MAQSVHFIFLAGIIVPDNATHVALNKADDASVGVPASIVEAKEGGPTAVQRAEFACMSLAAVESRPPGFSFVCTAGQSSPTVDQLYPTQSRQPFQ